MKKVMLNILVIGFLMSANAYASNVCLLTKGKFVKQSGKTIEDIYGNQTVEQAETSSDCLGQASERAEELPNSQFVNWYFGTAEFVNTKVRAGGEWHYTISSTGKVIGTKKNN